MNDLTPQEGLEQIFSEIDVEIEDVVRFLQMIHDLSEAVTDWVGDKNEGWTILRICSEIVVSLRKGYEVDISSLSESTGVSRDTIRRFEEKARHKTPKGPAFAKKGRRSVLTYDPIEYPDGHFWEKFVEIYNRNVNSAR